MRIKLNTKVKFMERKFETFGLYRSIDFVPELFIPFRKALFTIEQRIYIDGTTIEH